MKKLRRPTLREEVQRSTAMLPKTTRSEAVDGPWHPGVHPEVQGFPYGWEVKATEVLDDPWGIRAVVPCRGFADRKVKGYFACTAANVAAVMAHFDFDRRYDKAQVVLTLRESPDCWWPVRLVRLPLVSTSSCPLHQLLHKAYAEFARVGVIPLVAQQALLRVD